MLRTKAEALEKGIRNTEKILNATGCVALFLLMLLGAADVIGRYLLNRPIVGALEVGQILMATAILLGWAYTQALRAHIRVELVISLLPRRVRAIVNFTTLLLSLALFSVIVWRAAIIAMLYWKEGRVGETIHIPTASIEFLVSFGAFVLCLEFIIQMLRLLPEMTKEG